GRLPPHQPGHRTGRPPPRHPHRRRPLALDCSAPCSFRSSGRRPRRVAFRGWGGPAMLTRCRLAGTRPGTATRPGTWGRAWRAGPVLVSVIDSGAGPATSRCTNTGTPAPRMVVAGTTPGYVQEGAG